jgi:hypothetical protein
MKTAYGMFNLFFNTGLLCRVGFPHHWFVVTRTIDSYKSTQSVDQVCWRCGAKKHWYGEY